MNRAGRAYDVQRAAGPFGRRRRLQKRTDTTRVDVMEQSEVAADARLPDVERLQEHGGQFVAVAEVDLDDEVYVDAFGGLGDPDRQEVAVNSAARRIHGAGLVSGTCGHGCGDDATGHGGSIRERVVHG